MFGKKQIEITKDNVNLELLKSVPYGRLLETFENLGVKSAWVPGAKSNDMIQDAIGKLAILKGLKQDGLTESEIEDKINERELEQDNFQAKEAEAKLKEEAKAEKAQIKEIKKRDLSLAEVDDMISKLNRVIPGSIASHKPVLVKKLELFEKLRESLVK